MNHKKDKYPGCSHITIEEAHIFKQIGCTSGEPPEITDEFISCIDELLSLNKRINKNNSAIIHQKMNDRIINANT